MTKQEFLDELTIALQGELSSSEISENIRYYNNYILEEMSKGKSEEEVLMGLGDPRLIAKTIIETSNMRDANTDSYYYEDIRNDDGNLNRDSQEEGFKGFHADFNGNNGWDIKFGRLKLNTWYGKLIMGILAVLILSLVIVIVTGILRILIPIILPLVLILFLYALIKGNSNS